MTRRPGHRSRGGAAGLRAVPPARRLADLGAADSDTLLAAADDAVETVVAVLPARVALAGPAGLPAPPVDAEGLRRRHTAQTGVRFAALAAGADDLRAAAERVRARHRALAEEAGTLWERWSGPSAEEVADRVVSLGRAAHEIVTLLEETAETVEGAGLAVADDVTARAEAAEELAAELPVPPAGTDTAAARTWAADLDARLHTYLGAADRTDRAIAATWRDLAERIGVLRRLSGDDGADEPVDDPVAGALPPELLALPEILAALGPLTGDVPDDDPDPDDDPPGPGLGIVQTVDDSR
ncbi:WXG100 family type VII secretion target [Actinomycetospora endophytica]|uniref:WXG100 family type VII secretion target n=1 Tax=Actinomycetospora endophytica TaxID=2291215 RepID=A0ABS8P2N4_9PSEU|nr:WXG100 family type VII secretion target [Actinomycetospora endophytica]MCD2192507.1 WXG100 family type VII secretion target [Actinomycetospora endophytica]